MHYRSSYIFHYNINFATVYLQYDLLDMCVYVFIKCKNLLKRFDDQKLFIKIDKRFDDTRTFEFPNFPVNTDAQEISTGEEISGK